MQVDSYAMLSVKLRCTRMPCLQQLSICHKMHSGDVLFRSYGKLFRIPRIACMILIGISNTTPEQANLAKLDSQVLQHTAEGCSTPLKAVHTQDSNGDTNRSAQRSVLG